MADWVKNRLTLFSERENVAQIFSDISGRMEHDGGTMDLVIDFAKIRPLPPDVEAGRGDCFDYWGTTCYAFGQRKIDEYTIEFLTAWNGAPGLMRELSAQYPDVGMRYLHGAMMTDHGWVCGDYELLAGRILAGSAPARGTAAYEAISALFDEAPRPTGQAETPHPKAPPTRKGTGDSELCALGERDCLRADIGQLDITMRSFNCLKRAGIHTVGDLVALSEEALSAIRNLSPACVAEIKAKIESLGLSLASP